MKRMLFKAGVVNGTDCRSGHLLMLHMLVCFALFAMSCGSAAVETSDAELCEQAREHVAACTGGTLIGVLSTCEREQASNLLDHDCDTIGAALSGKSDVQRVFGDSEVLTPEQREIVFRYAPVLYQDTRPHMQPERWDFPTRVDFDGNFRTNDNEQALRRHDPMPAAVYYALIETETHYFITYSVYHALDWAKRSRWVPYTWHENDMENLQVVVRKDTQDVELVAAQAHFDTTLVIGPLSELNPHRPPMTGKEALLLNDDFHEEENGGGTHPALYVESGGHGLYDLLSKVDSFVPHDDPEPFSGMVFLPNRDNVASKYEKGPRVFHYELLSTHDTFWLPYVKDENIGNGGIMDGAFKYVDEIVSHRGLPRHLDSDQYSGPFKKDAGILPFAFSYALRSRDLGVLFFNPVKKYTSTLLEGGENEWSDEYVYHPYL